MSDTTSPVIRAVRFTIDERALSAAQVGLLARHAGCARQAWNWATGRWRDWRRNVREHVLQQARDHVTANPGTPPLHGEDLEQAARELANGRTDREWVKQARTRARDEHGQVKEFENAYELCAGYRRDAADPDSPRHWWYAEGAQSGLPLDQRHGVSTYAYQQALKDFSQTVKAFWAKPRYNKHTGQRVGEPQFKEHKGPQGFAVLNLAPNGSDPWRVISGGHRVVVPNIGSIRLNQNTKRLRRYIAKGGKPTSARFHRSAKGRWSVSITVQFAADNPYVQPRPTTSAQHAAGTVGVDLGVNTLAALSDGQMMPGLRLLRDQRHQLERLMRRQDRQHRAGSPDCFNADTGVHRRGGCDWQPDGNTPPSRRAQTTARQINRLHQQIARQRAGVLHELTKHLATGFDRVVIEDLDVAAMTARARPKPDPDNPGGFLPNQRRAKAGLNRAILDNGWAEFRRQLAYKTVRYGSTYEVVRPQDTSKTCSECGAVKAKLSLSERTYTCSTCGLVLDRDLNAARNIRTRFITSATPMERESSGSRGRGRQSTPELPTGRSTVVGRKDPPSVGQRGPQGTSFPQRSEHAHTRN